MVADSRACSWPPTLTVRTAEHVSSSTSAVPANAASTFWPSSVVPVHVPATAPSVAMVDVQSRSPSTSTTRSVAARSESRTSSSPRLRRCESVQAVAAMAATTASGAR